MRTYKKLLALLLAALMALGLTACAMDEAQVAAAGQVVGEIVNALDELPQEPAAEEAAPAEQEAEPEPAQDAAPAGETAPEAEPAETPVPPDYSLPEDPNGIGAEPVLDPEGWYTTKEDVALYLHLYGTLPGNFITKSEARDLGWSGGGLDGYADGMSIGGDRFGNYEGVLPDGDYHECDINTMHASKRGAERIIYATDGRIYYTNDHYETFELLYGQE